MTPRAQRERERRRIERLLRAHDERTRVRQRSTYVTHYERSVYVARLLAAERRKAAKRADDEMRGRSVWSLANLRRAVQRAILGGKDGKR